MAGFMAAMGALQAGTGLWQLIKNAEEGAPIDKVKNPVIPNSGRKYERAFNKLAAEIPGKERTIANEEIQRAATDSISRSEKLFKDPVLRFRAGALVNGQTAIEKVKANLATLKGKSELLSKAGRFGVSADHLDLNVWNSMLNLQTEKQRLYNERQYAAGEAIGAGAHNLSGALDPTNDFQDPDAYKMSREAYQQAKAASSSPEEFPAFKEWRYINFGKK